MPSSLPNASRSQEVPSLDTVQRRPAKASLSESPSVTDGPLTGLGGIVEAALVRVHGSKKAAAIELDKDRSQLRRQCELGTLMLRDLNNPQVLAVLGQMLVEEYGDVRKSRKQLALEQFRQLTCSLIDLMEAGEE